MRHFPTNCYNGAHLDVFRQPSPLSLSLLDVVSSLFYNFLSLIDKNTHKTLAYSTKIPIFAAKRILEEHEESVPP